MSSSPYIAALKAAGARRRAAVAASLQPISISREAEAVAREMGSWWQAQVGRLRVTYEHRLSNSSTGRFGGGWQWKLGVQAGGHSVIVSLLVATVRFDWR